MVFWVFFSIEGKKQLFDSKFVRGYAKLLGISFFER